MKASNFLGTRLWLIANFFGCGQQATFDHGRSLQAPKHTLLSFDPLVDSILHIPSQAFSRSERAPALIELLKSTYMEARQNDDPYTHENTGLKLLELVDFVEPAYGRTLADTVLGYSYFDASSYEETLSLRIRAAEKMISLAEGKDEKEQLKTADSVFLSTCGLPYGEQVLRQVLHWSRNEACPDPDKEIRAMEWVLKRQGRFPSHLGKVTDFMGLLCQFWVDVHSENAETRISAMGDLLVKIDLQMARPTGIPANANASQTAVLK